MLYDTLSMTVMSGDQRCTRVSLACMRGPDINGKTEQGRLRVYLSFSSTTGLASDEKQVRHRQTYRGVGSRTDRHTVVLPRAPQGSKGTEAATP